MANNPNDDSTDDFLEQILGFPTYAAAETNLTGKDAASLGDPMMLQLSSCDGPSAHLGGGGDGFPLGLSLEQGKGGFMNMDDASGSGKRFSDDVVDSLASASLKPQCFHAQPMPTTVPPVSHPPAIQARVRARRGKATDPHSIAERLRRERIAERIKALQELIPSVNKVLSMSRLGGAGAVAPLVTHIPISAVEDEAAEGGRTQPAWEKWSNDGTERQVAKLMEENVGAAMQFLQSKAICIMPISLAAAIYHTQLPDSSSLVKSETNPPS